MKFQTKIFIFSIIVLISLIATSPLWEGWILATFSVMISISVFFIGVVIFLENRHPSKTITWLVVLAAFPLVGFMFYILFGRNFRRRRMFAEKAKSDADEFQQLERYSPYDVSDFLSHVPDRHYRFFCLAHRIGNTPISFHSQTDVLTNGKQTYARILRAMQAAIHHIHLEYYIIRDDEIGRHIQSVLMEKARSGVEVRLIYDNVGSFRLPQKYINELQDAGVHVASFFPVRFPILNSRVNFRNHRKIVVVDGKIGFVGGLNIGDEYLGKHPYFGFWRDTHLCITGEAVRSIQMVFLLDWFYVTDEKLLHPTYLSPPLIEQASGQGAVQIISSGPDHEWEVNKKLFLSMIMSAKDRIWITTPYFIPDEDILSALKTAALSGVDVALMLPGKPDHKIVFWATRSYFIELLEAGITIHLYQNGFLHSKVFIIDQELASIGSTNMDMRSFHLNFEVNAFLYRTESVQQLIADMENDLSNCIHLDLHQMEKRPWSHRVYESLARLFSPLL